MSDNVTIDFNAGGNLGASLNQMIAQATEASKVTDGLVGQVGRLNAVTMALVTRTTALTGANKIAVAQAAAYQQAMAGIAATAAVTGQSFSSLEKVTLNLAKSISGGIGESVRIVQTLQQSGITAEKSIASLGKAFAELGEANGLDGAAIGKELLGLNRMFGNGEQSVVKFGDALTHVSKTFGASADGTLAFAKALAPVASSVGMSETAVLGLGAAAARLGEDGYASTNAFSKVLLDMQRSVRDGTPELKEYASMLNMSSTGLRDMFKSDPTEVLLRFTDAVKRGGPEASRALEALGMDSTRTIRSLTALSSGGDLRKSITQATSAYGDGSSSKAAKTAIGGVNEQMKMLQEALNQTVAAAGKPFLSWMEAVVGMANKVSGAIAGMANNDALQAVGKALAVGQGVAGIGMNAVSLASTAALGVVAAKGLGRGLRKAGAAARSVRAGGMAGPGVWNKAGGAFGAATPGGALPAPMAGMRPTLSGVASAAYRGTLNSASALANTNTNIINQANKALAGRGKGPIKTPGGVTARATMRAGLTNARMDVGAGQLGTAVKGLSTTISSAGKSFLYAENAGNTLARSLIRTATATTAFAANVAKSTARSAVSRIPGGWGTMAAMAGGAVAYEKYNDFQDKQKEYSEKDASGLKDGYSAFNEFAAAAGIAGKGLQDLATTIKQTTTDLVRMNHTREDALRVTSEEAANASSPGYQRAFTASNSQSAGVQGRMLLGGDPTPQTLARLVSDLTNQFGAASAEKIGAQVVGYDKNDTMSIYKDAAAAMASQQASWFGTANEETAKTGEQVGNTVNQAVDKATKDYGSEAGTKQKYVEASRLYAVAAAPGADPNAIKSNSEKIGELLGTDDQGMAIRGLIERKGGAKYQDFDKAVRDLLEHKDDTFNSAKGANYQGLADYKAAADAGFDVKSPDLTTTAKASPEELSAQALQDTLDRLAGDVDKSGGDLVDVLYGQARAARAGKSPESASAGSRAMASYLDSPTAKGQQEAAAYLTAGARDRYDTSSMSAFALLNEKSHLAESDKARDAFGLAQQNIAAIAPIENAAQDMSTRTGNAMAAGLAARQTAPYENSPKDEEGRQGTINLEIASFAERIAAMKQFVLAKRQLDKQLARSAEDAATSERRAYRDFNTERANSDHDFNLNRERQNADYSTNVSRQNEDYNTSVTRANRDFHKGENRALEDYNTGRMRTMRDFNKSMRRMVEDAAASMYDPYKRIQAAQTWDSNSLLANMREQNEAMQRQTAQLAQAQKMGLSQQAIDQLKLASPENAQQLNRLMQDAMNDPSIIRQFNSTAATRQGAAQGLVENDANKDYRRQREDLNTGLDDSHKDFIKSRDRNRHDFNQGMLDGEKDFHKQMARADKDFNKALLRQDKDYTTSMSRAKAKLDLSMEDMHKDLAKNRLRARQDLVHMFDDVADGVRGVITEFTAAVASLPKNPAIKGAFSTNLKTLVTDAKGMLTTYWDLQLGPYGLTSAVLAGQGDTHDESTRGRNQGNSGSTPSATSPASAGGVTPGTNASGTASTNGNVRGASASGNAQTTGSATHRAAGAVAVGESLAKIGEAGPELILPLNDQGSAFLAKLLVTSASMARSLMPDKDEAEKRKRREDLDRKRKHDDDLKNKMEEPMSAHAKHVAHLAHQDRVAARRAAEDRKTSNDRAAEIVRHVSGSSVRAAQVGSYSSPVTNNTHNYDQRTHITGPVTVQSQDPEAMARMLEAKAKLHRLRQPVGGRP